MKDKLSLVLCFGLCFLSACSTTAKLTKSAVALDLAKSRPARPEPGNPIDPVGMLLYMESEVTNLVQQGKINFALLPLPKTTNVVLHLAQPSSQVLTSAEIRDTVEMSVAVIGRIVKRGKRSIMVNTATGFFLTESGALVTCGHVLENGKKPLGLAVMTRDGRVCPVTQILALSADNDLAILQVDGSGFKPLSVASSIKIGAPVWVLSHPWPWYYLLTSGTVSSFYHFPATRLKSDILTITADFANGSSGAPVLNQSGALVGIANFTHTLFHPDKHEPQMAIKGCLPSSALLQMIKQE